MTDAATRQILTQALITKISRLEAELKRTREHGGATDDELREKAKRIRRAEADPIDTLHGGEFATMLIAERIPFRVDYPREFQSEFHVHPTDIDQAYNLLMKLRGSKLR